MTTSRRIRISTAAVLCIVCVATLVAGCAGPRAMQPERNPATLPDECFQAYLADVDLVTVDEAYRAMLILADGEDPCKTFDERREKLVARGIAQAEWRLQPENVIDSGSVAYMVCQICRVQGGVNMNLFGRAGLGDRRYALRELIYREMIPEDAVDYQYMTGAAMVAMMAKADALMAKKGLYETQVIELSDETDRDAAGNLIVPPPPRQ